MHLLGEIFHVQLAILHLLTTPFKLIIKLIFHFAGEDRHTWKRKMSWLKKKQKNVYYSAHGVVTFPHKTVLCSSFCALTIRPVNIFRHFAFFTWHWWITGRVFPNHNRNLLKFLFLAFGEWKRNQSRVKLMMRIRAPFRRFVTSQKSINSRRKVIQLLTLEFNHFVPSLRTIYRPDQFTVDTLRHRMTSTISMSGLISLFIFLGNFYGIETASEKVNFQSFTWRSYFLPSTFPS